MEKLEETTRTTHTLEETRAALKVLKKLSARHSVRLRGELVTHDNDLDDTNDDT